MAYPFAAGNLLSESIKGSWHLLTYPQTPQTLYFLADGHASTRVLVDAVGAIANINGVEQVFFYDAYGNLLNMATSAAATSFLFSGEQFDAKIGQQYLRARYYDTTTGRFNRLDDFAGNNQDPQSFHKYLYVHADPVNGVDPTGLYNAISAAISTTIGSTLVSTGAGAVVGAGVGAGVFGGLSEDDYIWDDLAEGAIVGGSIGLAFRVAAYRKNIGETFANGIISGLVDLGVTYLLNSWLGQSQPTWQASTKQFLRAFQSAAVSTALTSIINTDQGIGFFKSFGASTGLQMLQQSVRFYIDPQADHSYRAYFEPVVVPSVSTAILGTLLSSKLSLGIGGDLGTSLNQWSVSRQILASFKRFEKSLPQSAKKALKTEFQRKIIGNNNARSEVVGDIVSNLIDKSIVGVVSGPVSTLPRSLERWVDLIDFE